MKKRNLILIILFCVIVIYVIFQDWFTLDHKILHEQQIEAIEEIWVFNLFDPPPEIEDIEEIKKHADISKIEKEDMKQVIKNIKILHGIRVNKLPEINLHYNFPSDIKGYIIVSEGKEILFRADVGPEMNLVMQVKEGDKKKMFFPGVEYRKNWAILYNKLLRKYLVEDS